jgi:hypothetical protein
MLDGAPAEVGGQLMGQAHKANLPFSEGVDHD